MYWLLSCSWLKSNYWNVSYWHFCTYILNFQVSNFSLFYLNAFQSSLLLNQNPCFFQLQVSCSSTYSHFHHYSAATSFLIFFSFHGEEGVQPHWPSNLVTSLTLFFQCFFFFLSTIFLHADVFSVELVDKNSFEWGLSFFQFVSTRGAITN